MKEILTKYIYLLYEIIWTAIIPVLKRNNRIADGFHHKTLAVSGLSISDIWIQSASAGEAFLTKEILEKLDPSETLNVLATANTRQGLDILEKTAVEINGKSKNIHVNTCFFPFDSPKIMKKAVTGVRPRLMVLVELEVWPGLLNELKKSNCPVLVVNGRLTERSLKRYMIFPYLWKKLSPSSVLAMSTEDEKRFRKLFPESQVTVVPNIKFDRVPLSSNKQTDNPISFLAGDNIPVIVLGSVREEEEGDVLKIIEKITFDFPESRIFLFPRHMHRLNAWDEKLTSIKADFARRTEAEKKRPRIILWDVFGELTHAYNLSHAAFIGGSLAPLGGQNFLEALACGVIPVTGPYLDNFAWVGKEIVEKGLLHIGQNWSEVADILIRNVRNPKGRNSVKAATDSYLAPLRGGTAVVCRKIETMLENNYSL